MSLYKEVLSVSLCCVLLVSIIASSTAFSMERVRRDSVQNPLLTIDVLESLVDNLKGQVYSQQKRRYDAGYGGRFGVAHSVGSKLMVDPYIEKRDSLEKDFRRLRDKVATLKQAADWTGPGR